MRTDEDRGYISQERESEIESLYLYSRHGQLVWARDVGR